MTATTRPPEAAAHVREGTGHGTDGTGRAACHHGEILQGVFLDERRRPVQGLVTLPMHGPGSTARFARRPGSPPDEVTVTPA
ncbi:GHMP kinase, partial [Streptomyces sp. NPDC049744]